MRDQTLQPTLTSRVIHSPLNRADLHRLSEGIVALLKSYQPLLPLGMISCHLQQQLEGT